MKERCKNKKCLKMKRKGGFAIRDMQVLNNVRGGPVHQFITYVAYIMYVMYIEGTK